MSVCAEEKNPLCSAGVNYFFSFSPRRPALCAAEENPLCSTGVNNFFSFSPGRQKQYAINKNDNSVTLKR